MKPTRIALALALLSAPLALSQIPAVRAALLSLVVTMRHGGAIGVAAYALSYCAAALVASPIALFSAMAGYAWGMPRALLFASPVGALAASCAFLAGRFVLRSAVTRRCSGDPRWQSVEQALSREPLRIALLLRATPFVPQNFLSYGLAVSRVSYKHFVTATFVGMLPVTAVQAYVGSLLHDAVEVVQGVGPRGPLQWALPALGLGVSALTTVLTARLARNALQDAL